MIRADLLPSEYNSYYKHYLELISGLTSVHEVLNIGLKESLDFINSINANLDYRYAAGKWTIAHVIMHNIDTERVFAYRALRFMRGDATPLPGFDQDIFALDYENHAFAKADLLQSFQTTREATIALFNNVTTEQLLKQGMASDNKMSVRVIPFLIAGHTKHHENIIRERYL
ncbi:MAG: DinB family protein [Nonlabens sp.]|uniref:DinB family protein n=1 Tax=Nonlabens sp. TaxID=1888209 RepID=UPI003EF8D8D3